MSKNPTKILSKRIQMKVFKFQKQNQKEAKKKLKKLRIHEFSKGLYLSVTPMTPVTMRKSSVKVFIKLSQMMRITSHRLKKKHTPKQLVEALMDLHLENLLFKNLMRAVMTSRMSSLSRMTKQWISRKTLKASS